MGMKNADLLFFGGSMEKWLASGIARETSHYQGGGVAATWYEFCDKSSIKSSMCWNPGYSGAGWYLERKGGLAEAFLNKGDPPQINTSDIVSKWMSLAKENGRKEGEEHTKAVAYAASLLAKETGRDFHLPEVILPWVCGSEHYVSEDIQTGAWGRGPTMKEIEEYLK